MKLYRSNLLKSSMLALSVVGILGCGSGSTSADGTVNMLSEKAVAAPVLIGFNTAVPSSLKPGDAVGHVGSAYSPEMNRATLGDVSYSLSGNDAGKFAIDEIGFIRATQTLQNDTNYALELTAENSMGYSTPVDITIYSGALSDQTKSSRCFNCDEEEEEKVVCATMQNTIHINENSTYVSNITSSLGVAFTLESGIDMDKFEFDGDELKFKDAPDYELPTSLGADNEYLVNVTDGGEGKQELKIIVENIPDTVPLLKEYSAVLPETTLANTLVGNVGTLLEGENDIQFIVLKDAANTTVRDLNFYVDIFGNIYTNKDMVGLVGDHQMTATAYNESGWSDPVTVAFNVSDVEIDDALMNPLLANVDENSVGGTKVGLVKIDDLGDLDLANVNQIDLVSYNYDDSSESENASPFELVIETGKLWLQVKAAYDADKLDYEKVTFYTFKMQLHDTVAGLSTNRVCAYVQINDIDEEDPIFVSDEPVTKNINENIEYIGTFKAFDETKPVNYKIVGGADDDKFKIEQVGNDSFKLSFDATKFDESEILDTGVQLPDFEHPNDSDNDNIYVVQVKGTDSVALPEGTHSKTVEYHIHVQNIFEVLPELENPGALSMAFSGESAILNVENKDDMDGEVAGFELGSEWKNGVELFGTDKKFAINSSSGRLYISGGDDGDEGFYMIEARAKNEAGSWGAYQTYVVTVTTP